MPWGSTWNLLDAVCGSFAELEAYQKKRGGCNVPQKWAEDRQLGSCVDNQRAKKKGAGPVIPTGHPHGGDERRGAIERLGFVWVSFR